MKKKIDLGKDSISKLFIKFAIPAVIGMIATTIAGLVDSFFIGNKIGGEGIAGITLVAPIINILLGVAAMITAGGVVLAGIARGKEKYDESNNYFNVTCFLSLVIGVIIMLVVFVFNDFLVKNILNVDGITAQYVKEYSQILAVFILAYMFVFTFSFFLKIDGMPNLVVIGTLMGVVINVIFDYLFVDVFSFGMRGAAFATGLSQLIPCAVFLYAIIFKSTWKFKKPVIVKKDVISIFYNGSSELLSLASVGIAGYIYNLIINKYIGAQGIAAYGIAMQIAGMAVMIFYGISDSIQSMVSFNFGAKKFDRVDKIRNIAFGTSLVTGVIMCAVLMIFGKSLAALFIKDVKVVELAYYIMFFYGISLLFAGININASTYYTALGQPKKSAILAVVRSLIALVLGLLVMPVIFGNVGVWLPLIFTEIVTIGFVVYYIKSFPYGKKKELMAA